MRILILALTFGLGLTLNAKEENSISKKDSIHFIDGFLIMANDTISLDEFLFLAKRRYERTASSQNDEATVIYLRQAKKMIYAEENSVLAKGGGGKWGSFSWRGAGVLLGTAGLVAGGLIIGTAGSSDFGILSGIIGLIQFGSGVSLMAGGTIAIAASSAGATARPTVSSAHHKLAADDYIDKAVNSYNR
jgi:hypothetical protein